jgi:hypothetical protein
MRWVVIAAITFLIMAIVGGSYYVLDQITSQVSSRSENASVSIEEPKTIQKSELSSGSERPLQPKYVQSYNTSPEPVPSSEWFLVALVALSIATLISTAISFYQYRWRRILLSGSHTEIVVPEQFGGWVQGINKQIESFSIQLGGSVKYVTRQSKDTRKNVSDLTDTFMTLQQALDERDAEIRRLKRGYDAEIFRKFIARFIRVDQIVEEFQEAGKANADELGQIRRLLEDAFSECDVEAFQPEIGSDYRTAHGVADNPKSEEVADPDDAFKIIEIIENGYRIKTSDGYDVLVPAKVKIRVLSI